ncbi:alpha/beta hydrolase [Roseateles cavernae]|uniref:alpha/beta hydrolase n=1 Tax=Roseateles cavernae TaxID=3153578 RepID=UPI0032E4D5CD
MSIRSHADANPDPEAFLDAFIERARRAPAYASALYAAGLHAKVQPKAAPGIFGSMVQLSDHGGLMQKFLGLACPRMFMYGSQNASLSYLAHLEANGVRLAEIHKCGHFPMYSNPPAMWSAFARFISDAEAAQA